MKRMSDYCKAYQAKRFREFPQWATARELGDEDVLFLHDSFVVTDGIFVDEQIVFDAVTPEWREFCRVTLGFEIPEYCRADAAEAAQSAAQTAEAAGIAEAAQPAGAALAAGIAEATGTTGLAKAAVAAREEAAAVEQSA